MRSNTVQVFSGVCF